MFLKNDRDIIVLLVVLKNVRVIIVAGCFLLKNDGDIIVLRE